ncbi:response regulator [Robiginitomaculum antarcticum]|uniref:hypothetical protein n=1 Tax=Robiginitomaculum antarcticum TaxID=437507 RepID=UPI0003636397|nr:hypothetical protein [Robiginitomaculum antarcticum]
MTVEDNIIISLDTEEMMRTLGASRVSAVATVDEAMATMEASALTFALLDINLGTDTSESIARKLSDCNIPFAFATGYGRHAEILALFPDAPIVQKPYGIESIKAAIEKLLIA